MAPEMIRCEAQSFIASVVYAFRIDLLKIDACALLFYEREKMAACSGATLAPQAEEAF